MPTALFLNPSEKPPIIRDSLPSAKPESQSLINDFRSLKVTRELMSSFDLLFDASTNVSRKNSTSNISVANWVDHPRVTKDSKTLLVVDPAQDSPIAAEESLRIREDVPKRGIIQVTEITVQDATKNRFSKEFVSGEYDMVCDVHHAYSDPTARPVSQSDLQEKSMSEASPLTTRTTFTTVPPTSESRCSDVSNR